jgi:hypothetical protein
VPDPLAIGAAILGAISTAIAIASRLWPTPPPAAPRETALPAAPTMPQSSAHECLGCVAIRAEFAALRVAVERQSTDIEGLVARERAALQEAARIAEKIRALRNGGGGDGREGSKG